MSFRCKSMFKDGAKKRIFVGAVLVAFAPLTPAAYAPPVQSCAAGNPVPHHCLVADPGDPTWDINDYDPSRDADDWCKLACNEPHKARRQLSKAVALVRSENNPNRLYFDPKRGSQLGLYVQLLRPWMKAQNDAATHRWRVVQEGRSIASEEHRFARIGDTLGAGEPRFTVLITEAKSVRKGRVASTDALRDIGETSRHGEVGYRRVIIFDGGTRGLAAAVCDLYGETGRSHHPAEGVKAAIEQALDHLGNEAPRPDGDTECTDRQRLNPLLDLAPRSYNHFDPERYYFDPRTQANANPLSWAAWDRGMWRGIDHEPAPDDGYIQVRRPWMGNEWRVVSEDVDDLRRRQAGNSIHNSHRRGRITRFFLMAPERYMVLTISQPPLEAGRAYNPPRTKRPDSNPTVFLWELLYHSADAKHAPRVRDGLPYACSAQGTGYLNAELTKREIEEFLDAQEHGLVREVFLSQPTSVGNPPLTCVDRPDLVR